MKINYGNIFMMINITATSSLGRGGKSFNCSKKSDMTNVTRSFQVLKLSQTNSKQLPATTAAILVCTSVPALDLRSKE